MRGLIVLLIILLTTGSALAERAGKVNRVLPAGFITHETKTAEAKPADPVDWNDVVRTSKQGRMRIALEDQSLLTLGSETEMRILKHDPASQQTSVELLYGRIRNKVTKLTKQGGSYNIRTPVAVVGVIGTELILDSPAAVTTVTREQLEQLPNGQRSFGSLLDLQPGTFPGATPAGEPNISDFQAVQVNRVYAIDGVTAVKNIDPKITEILYLLPGEAAVIERGKPPRRFNPREPKDHPETLDQAFFGPDPNCPGLIDLSMIEKLPGGAKYKVFGRGSSTGETFEVEVTNPDPNCPLNVFVPNGAVLKPKGFVKRAVIGALLGGGIPIGNYQLMISEGGSAEIAPASSTGAGMPFAAPAGGTASFTLRGFCLELHKAPPAPNTEYEFDSGKTREFGGHRTLMEAVHRMFHQGALRPTIHDPDSIIQWSLWARREKMKEDEFKDEFSRLVKQNLEKQKKWNKDSKKQVAAAATDLWDKVEKVLAATPAK